MRVLCLCGGILSFAVGAAEPQWVNIAGAAHGTRVTADTQFNEAHGAQNAANGTPKDMGGCWFSKDWTKLPCALTFELAEPSDLRRIALVQAKWNGNMYHTRDFALETSADGKAWTRVATGQLPDQSLARVAVDGRWRTRWLRVVVLNSYNPKQTCGLAEVELLAANHVGFGPAQVTMTPPAARACPVAGTFGGLSVVADAAGPQALLHAPDGSLLACVRPGEELSVAVPALSSAAAGAVSVEAELADGTGADVELRIEPLDVAVRRSLSSASGPVTLEARLEPANDPARICLRTIGAAGESAVRWRRAQLQSGGRISRVPLRVTAPDPGNGPPPTTHALRPAVQRALIEWDWRMQDGIGTERKPDSYEAAVARLFERGDALLRDLRSNGVEPGDAAQRWESLRREKPAGEKQWEDLWRRAHGLRREIVFANPLANTGPLLFVKQVPSMFSHQLTQYYGSCARPGGGVFVLDEPGRTMHCRQLAPDALPVGSFQYPEVSHDGRRVMFAYCHVETSPANRDAHPDRHYHLYEMAADGSRLRRLTDGEFDDFAGRYLPDGRIVFISTRRGGFHRCGRGPCPTYTLALANADGSDPHPISFHETHEWDPAVLNDGRVIYTRWDYVDRNAVHYQQLWTVRPDGTDVRAFYGNNTLNPVGVWEARPVPGSSRVMATAAAHHAMTAGSIILLDVKRGVDGLEPITRLTPDALFPESEAPVSHGTAKAAFWHAPAGVPVPPPVPPEAERWPGHCYRTPWPLSEKYFLAAYSFDALIGEPSPNPANMFGLYLVDAFGNKELLYRDPAIASLWPMPLRPRQKPPTLPLIAEATLHTRAVSRDGVFFLENVYDAWPQLPEVRIRRLRIVQVLPKTTPHINTPTVGLANASPAKQVLGTVPVEADGSACFRAPAGVALAFQALDERGQAVQTMRSATYLQPGERVSCIGCHESRAYTPASRRAALALSRPPSTIAPGPDGSKPLSYPILVQPVLDKHCVSCHSGPKPAGKIVLTGAPAGRYSASYNALAARVSFSAWGGKPGDFRVVNSEPMSQPDFFGARGSPLMKMLLRGHHDVKLSASDLERLATWMDANALFYGTFDLADQARQLRGERIEGPKLQ